MSFISGLGDTLEGLGGVAEQVGDIYGRYRAGRERGYAANAPRNPRGAEETAEDRRLREYRRGTIVGAPPVTVPITPNPSSSGVLTAGSADMLTLAGLLLLGLSVASS